MPARSVERDVQKIEEEALDPRHGGARWRMLVSADRTPTDSLTCGVATIAPGQALALHRHAHAELYYGLEGEALAIVGGQEHVIRPGVALFIPGNVLHGVHVEGAEAKLLFAFAADCFSDVRYVFPGDD